MKRGLPVIGLLVAMGLVAAGPASSDEVIVGTTSVWLEKDSTINGDVVANEDAGERPTLVAGVELQIDKNTAVVGLASGDAIGTETGATASDGFFCNELDGVPCDPPLGLPVLVLPPFETTTQPLLNDFSVGNNQSDSIDAGAYRDITVGKKGTLCFTGGVYEVNSIAAADQSKILFAAPTVIRMDGALSTGKKSTFGPDVAGACATTVTAPSAAEVVVYIAGVNDDPHEDPAVANFGDADNPNSPAAKPVVEGNFYVPNGTIHLHKEAAAVGLFLGRDVLVEKTSTLTADSAFDFAPPALEAHPQDVSTEEDNALEIILTGFDPEGEDLSFSTVSGSGPSSGTLGPITPIVPDEVGRCSESANSCEVDADCPGTETCESHQPAIDSASVTYTPTSALCVPDPETGVLQCPADSFDFTVEDPDENMSDPATVSINAPGDTNPPPDPLEDVVAHPATVETLVNTAVTVTMHGSAPCVGECDGVDDVELTFSIVGGTGPSAGTLGTLVQGSDVPQRTAFVDYTPNTGFAGTDSFDFQVAGDTNDDGDTLDPGETSTATATIEVEPPAPPQDPVADPVVATTEMDTEIMIGLSGTPGNEGGAPLALPLSGLSSIDSGANGGSAVGGVAGGSRVGPTAITIGAGWSATTAVPPAFFWSGTPPVLSTDGPFTFTGEACVSVTDDFDKGDQFRLIDAGTDIGTTPLVPQLSAPEVGPDAAYDDSTYSSATFEVGDGSHSIDIEIVPPNSFSVGRGYIRVDSLDSEFCSDTCGLTFAVVDPPNSGTVGIVSQTSSTTAEILYTPTLGFVGIDSFSYSVTDCFGLIDIALVDLTIIDSSACSTCYTLTVQLAGGGTGDVTSNPTGIACPSSSCAADFTQNSAVVLQARPLDEFVFSGWGGDCAGASPLETVVLTSDKTCVANFN